MSRPFLYRRSTWRGTFVDLWTVPHVISGAVIAYVSMLMGIHYTTAFWMALSIGIGWELFERITHLSRTEAYSNSICDFIAAQLGFIAMWWLCMYVFTELYAGIFIAGITVLFAGVCLLGYRAFKYYG